jgi:hypothetical protein
MHRGKNADAVVRGACIEIRLRKGNELMVPRAPNAFWSDVSLAHASLRLPIGNGQDEDNQHKHPDSFKAQP